jgi:glutaminyl-tRNA synthetase
VSGTRQDFIREQVAADNATGRHGGRVATRFPPEPNGYLHIGHAKSICLNFGIARDFGGTCNLRFDDTNPVTEDTEYVDSIQDDVRFGFGGPALPGLLESHTLRRCCSGRRVSAARVQTDPGRRDAEEPDRQPTATGRSASLALAHARREFPTARMLRAKIDMASWFVNMRDDPAGPSRAHHRTRDAWCIYPMYDYAHPISDALERITHSICTLEFEDHRPLYDWLIQNLPLPGTPQQIEFARLNLTYTVMSKRKLLQLVEEGHVSAWDDPRMPTISGLRRRGYTPEAIRRFADEIGVAKRENVVDVGLLEFFVREDLNKRAPRAMAVLRPLKVVIENYPDGLVEDMDVVNNPEDPSAGRRKVPFSNVLYIERDDFRLDPPKKFFRLAPAATAAKRVSHHLS